MKQMETQEDEVTCPRRESGLSWQLSPSLPPCPNRGAIQTCLCELLVAFPLSGNLFLEFQEELERVYKVYCANYDQALLLVESYRREPELQQEIQAIIEAVV